MGLRGNATAMPVLNSSEGAAWAAAASDIHGVWVVSVNNMPEKPAPSRSRASRAVAAHVEEPVVRSNRMCQSSEVVFEMVSIESRLSAPPIRARSVPVSQVQLGAADRKRAPPGWQNGDVAITNINRALSAVDAPWSPRTIAVINDYDVRVVRAHGEFTRHRHPDTDEFFLVLSGRLIIRTDQGDIALEPGDVHVVPRGMYHQPCAERETTLLLIEPSETVNTGDTPSELTAERRMFMS
jgi:mannose-6-phosphate isomerase-like protein (cupin superfamily)